MATLLTHLRIAERLSDQINIIDRSVFFVGSIAPDTDVPPDISHWCINSDKTTCDAQSFYAKYISGCINKENLDFYLGYYIHLLTDILWHKQKIAPLNNKSKDIIQEKKLRWRNVDNCFLVNNRDFKPLMEMMYAMKCTCKYDKRWLDYYESDQVKMLIEGALYNLDTFNDDKLIEDPVMETEINRFIDECVEFIKNKILDISLNCLVL